MFAVYREKDYCYEIIAYCTTREDAMIICDAFFAKDSTYPIGIWKKNMFEVVWKEDK